MLDGVGAEMGKAYARRDGVLLGWATLLEPEDGEPGPTLEWTLVSREDDELWTLVRLVEGAASRARAAGYTALLWSTTEPELDDRLAAEVNAEVLAELGRGWSTGDLRDWAAPPGLPGIRVRRMPEPPSPDLLAQYVVLYNADHDLHDSNEEWTEDGVLEWLDHSHMGPDFQTLTLDLLDEHGTVAQLTTGIQDDYAAVGKVIHHEADPAELASAICELVAQLRQQHPEAATLTVMEHGDEIVSRAAVLAGLRVSQRMRTYLVRL